MTGTRTPSAAYPFSSGLDVRQVGATSTIPEFPDRFLVNLFRNGKLVRSVGLDELMRTDASKASTKLQPGDTIAILAIPTVRVWVTGLVAKPGEFVLPDGADLYQAIAAAGGAAQEFASDQELKVLVRRGPETKEFPVIPNPGTPGFRLQAGDTLALVAPQQVRVTLAGEVKEPGPIVIRETESVIGAVAKAGGVTIDGTLQRMILIRGDEQFILNETVEADGTREVRFKLQNGDLLVVRRNTRTALVLGEVKDAKPVVLKDGKVYRLADVVAEAGGTGPKGTTVRVYVGRPDPKTNKMVATLYRLDRYLKSGDLTQNPVIEPGDVILVGEAQKNTLESISQVLSLAFYFDALVRR
jgi:protein involved in polysaccharide export with SLBB domain